MSGPHGFHWSPCPGGGGLGGRGLLALGLLAVAAIGVARAIWRAIGAAVTEAAEIAALAVVSLLGLLAAVGLVLAAVAIRRRLAARPAPAAPPWTVRAEVLSTRPAAACPSPETPAIQGEQPGTVPGGRHLRAVPDPAPRGAGRDD